MPAAHVMHPMLNQQTFGEPCKNTRHDIVARRDCERNEDLRSSPRVFTQSHRAQHIGVMPLRNTACWGQQSAPPS